MTRISFSSFFVGFVVTATVAVLLFSGDCCEARPSAYSHDEEIDDAARDPNNGGDDEMETMAMPLMIGPPPQLDSRINSDSNNTNGTLNSRWDDGGGGYGGGDYGGGGYGGGGYGGYYGPQVLFGEESGFFQGPPPEIICGQMGGRDAPDWVLRQCEQMGIPIQDNLGNLYNQRYGNNGGGVDYGGGGGYGGDGGGGGGVGFGDGGFGIGARSDDNNANANTNTNANNAAAARAEPAAASQKMLFNNNGQQSLPSGSNSTLIITARSAGPQLDTEAELEADSEPEREPERFASDALAR